MVPHQNPGRYYELPSPCRTILPVPEIQARREFDVDFLLMALEARGIPIDVSRRSPEPDSEVTGETDCPG